MDNKDGDLIPFFHGIPNQHKYWGWFLAMGLVLLVLGALAIGFAKWATEFSVILLGILLLGAGLIQISSGFYAKKWTGFSLSLFLGLFYLIAGSLCILKPMQSALSISLLIAAVLLIGGLFRIVSALRYRFNNWGFVAFNGLTSALLGILILAEWPASAVWVIGLFVGIDLLLMGGYWVFLSWVSKR